MPHPSFIRDLGDGLVLRRATPEDCDALVRFNAITHSDNAEPDCHVAGHTYDLIKGRCPALRPAILPSWKIPALGRSSRRSV